MTEPIILASASAIRQTLLRNAGLSFEVSVARVDEQALTTALRHDGATPRDIADTLAEMKAQKVSSKAPQALVIGCDQVLSFKGQTYGKPENEAAAVEQLMAMSGQAHQLLSAVVIYQGGEPLWRHVGAVRLQMHDLSQNWVEAYVHRNWDSIRHSAGSYKLEEEGVRLFAKVEGDYFTVLGLPLLPLLSYLTTRGTLSL